MNIEQAWSEFHQRLRRFIAARVADPHTVDELTQRLLIKSYRNFDTLNDTERVGGWLYRIARNVINDYYRERARDPEHAFEDVDRFADTLADTLNRTDAATAVREELSRCVRPFVEQLPAEYRHTLLATDLGEVSQKGLADRLGVSHSTVKSRTQRARALLRKEFRRCCDFTTDARGNIVDYQPKSGRCDSRCDCGASATRAP